MDANLLSAACISGLQCEESTSVPCEVSVAQWALESGWGTHSPGNNPFGIKGEPETGQLLATTEWFGPTQAALWVKAKAGRTAIPIPNTNPDSQGRTKYACRDWLAVFPTLADAFISHAQLLIQGRYLPWLEKFKADKNMTEYVDGIGPIYATDPNYSKTVLAIIGMTEVETAITSARNTPKT